MYICSVPDKGNTVHSFIAFGILRLKLRLELELGLGRSGDGVGVFGMGAEIVSELASVLLFLRLRMLSGLDMNAY